MPDKRQLIEQIQARSRSLAELLRDATPASEPRVARPLVEALSPWIRVFSPGDPAALLRRLSWDSIPPESAARALGGAGQVSLPSSREEEAFRNQIEMFIRASRDRSTPVPLEAPDVPFMPVLAPFLRLAHGVIAKTIRETGLFSEEAVVDLLRELALQLSWWSSPTLLDRFDAGRSSGTSFERFCADVLDHPLEFWSDHAALLRRLLLLTEQWIAVTKELARRLDHDRDTIRVELNATVDKVARVRTGLSDRHHGGRQVAILTSSNGNQVVYKPRESRSLLRFNELLRWYALHGGDEAPRPIQVIDRDDYAWVELARHEELGSPDDVALYFRRSGALLFFAWILGGRDLHMDNIICTKAGPVIIDTEVFVQPQWTEDSEHHPGAIQLARRKVSGSVVGSGMLSFPQEDARGRVYDIGGLCGRGGYVSPSPRRVWRNVNTDDMELAEEDWTVDSMENVVRCEGRIENPEDWVAEIVSGFETAASTVISLREELLAPSGPLARFDDASARILFRPSNHYATLLQTMTSVPCGRSGLTASLYVESLARVFSGEESIPELWPLVREEREALEALDIPMFTVSCSSTAIETREGTRLEGLIAKSGVHALAERVARFDADAVAEQSKLIRATLVSNAGHSDEDEETPITTAVPHDTRRFIDEAVGVGETLVAASIQGSDGAVTWVAPEYVKITSIADLGATYYLYSGVTGPSIFLAALGRVTGDGRFARVARRAWSTLERLIESGDARPVRNQLRLGICNGIGSIVYAAIIAGRLLDDPSLLELARGFAELIDPERLDTEGDFDIEGGLAGAALALVSLHEATGDDRWLELSRRAAHRMADLAASDEGGAWWTAQAETPALAGMAHGAGGAAVALASTALAAGDSDLAALAREAMRWERTIYDSSIGNWPVRTSEGRRIDMVAWCHGAAGIGLTRIATRPLVGRMFDDDLDLAAHSVAATGLHPVDHLCCGNTGRIEFLVEASRALSRPDLLDEARRRALAMVDRATTRGRFTLTTEAGEDLVRPGFFRGLSGIGYTLLRVAEPTALPSIARFALREENLG